MERVLRAVERSFGYDFVEPGAQRELRSLLSSLVSLLLDQTYFIPQAARDTNPGLLTALIDNWVIQNIHYLPRSFGVQEKLLDYLKQIQSGARLADDALLACASQYNRALLSPSFIPPRLPVSIGDGFPWGSLDGQSLHGTGRYGSDRLKDDLPESGRGRRTRSGSGRGRAASPPAGSRLRKDEVSIAFDEARADWMDRSIGGTDLLGLGIGVGGVVENADSPEIYDSASLSSSIASKRAVYHPGPTPAPQASPFSSALTISRSLSGPMRDQLDPDTALALSRTQTGCRALHIVTDPQNPGKGRVKFSVGALVHGNVVDLRPLVQELLPFHQAHAAKNDILEDMVVSTTSLLNEHCGYDTLIASVAEKAAAGFYFPATGKVAGPQGTVGIPGFVPTQNIRKISGNVSPGATGQHSPLNLVAQPPGSADPKSNTAGARQAGELDAQQPEKRLPGSLSGDKELAEFLFQEFVAAPPMRTTKSQYGRIAAFSVPPDCVTYRASGGYGDAFAQLLDKDLEALTARSERFGYQTVEEEMRSRRPSAQRAAQSGVK